MEKLKIGDKICAKGFGFARDIFYIEEIERITKTLIITKSGNRLKNLGNKASDGNGSRIYTLFDEDMRKEKEKSDYISKIEKWFSEKEFTFEEKEKIYNLFNK